MDPTDGVSDDEDMRSGGNFDFDLQFAPDLFDASDESCVEDEEEVGEFADVPFTHHDNGSIEFEIEEGVVDAFLLAQAKTEVLEIRRRVLQKTLRMGRPEHGTVELSHVIPLTLTTSIFNKIKSHLSENIAMRNVGRKRSPIADVSNSELEEFFKILCELGYTGKTLTKLFKDVERYPNRFGRAWLSRLSKQRASEILAAFSGPRRAMKNRKNRSQSFEGLDKMDPELCSLIQQISEVGRRYGFVNESTIVSIDDDKHAHKSKHATEYGASLLQIFRQLGTVMHVAASVVTNIFVGGNIQCPGESKFECVKALVRDLSDAKTADLSKMSNVVTMDRGYQTWDVLRYLIESGCEVHGTVPRTKVSAFVYGRNTTGRDYVAKEDQRRVQLKGSKGAYFATKRIQTRDKRKIDITCCAYRLGSSRIGLVQSTLPMCKPGMWTIKHYPQPKDNPFDIIVGSERVSERIIDGTRIRDELVDEETSEIRSGCDNLLVHVNSLSFLTRAQNQADLSWYLFRVGLITSTVADSLCGACVDDFDDPMAVDYLSLMGFISSVSGDDEHEDDDDDEDSTGVVSEDEEPIEWEDLTEEELSTKLDQLSQREDAESKFSRILKKIGIPSATSKAFAVVACLRKRLEAYANGMHQDLVMLLERDMLRDQLMAFCKVHNIKGVTTNKKKCEIAKLIVDWIRGDRPTVNVSKTNVEKLLDCYFYPKTKKDNSMRLGSANEDNVITGLGEFMETHTDWRLAGLTTLGLVKSSSQSFCASSLDSLASMFCKTPNGYERILTAVEVKSKTNLKTRRNSRFINQGCPFESVHAGDAVRFRELIPDRSHRTQCVHHAVVANVRHCLYVIATTEKIQRVVLIEVSGDIQKKHKHVLEIVHERYKDIFMSLRGECETLSWRLTDLELSDKLGHVGDLETLVSTCKLRKALVKYANKWRKNVLANVKDGDPTPGAKELAIPPVLTLLPTIVDMWNNSKGGVDVFSRLLSHVRIYRSGLKVDGFHWLRCVLISLHNAHCLWRIARLSKKAIQSCKNLRELRRIINDQGSIKDTFLMMADAFPGLSARLQDSTPDRNAQDGPTNAIKRSDVSKKGVRPKDKISFWNANSSTRLNKDLPHVVYCEMSNSSMSKNPGGRKRKRSKEPSDHNDSDNCADVENAENEEANVDDVDEGAGSVAQSSQNQTGSQSTLPETESQKKRNTSKFGRKKTAYCCFCSWTHIYEEDDVTRYAKLGGRTTSKCYQCDEFLCTAVRFGNKTSCWDKFHTAEKLQPNDVRRKFLSAWEDKRQSTAHQESPEARSTRVRRRIAQ